MELDSPSISETRCKRLRAQGLPQGLSDAELGELAIGNRFAYQLCTVLFSAGLVLTSIPVLVIAAGIAFLAVVLPYHPFDYLYNHGLRHWLDKPKLPKRPAQSKFACGVAGVWLSGISYLFHLSLFTWGYIAGVVLFVVALLVSTIDFCIPSLVCNTLFRRTRRARS